VVDSLDSDFRLSSLRPGYSDHNYTVTMNENGVASFKFPNINLPWQSQYGDNLSSGMFTYSIKLKKGLPLGTKIRNKAAIYFDYNEPVITNETVNTIASNGTVTVAEISQLRADEILLYPNPANTHVTLVVMGNETSAGTLSIYDISGREISAREIRLQAGENYLHEDTGELQSGIYFVQLKSGNIVSGKKLVIAR
jgi:hypothetical protein